jgi:heme/copper-type cytochrome/quinol oxidase subunit 2
MNTKQILILVLAILAIEVMSAFYPHEKVQYTNDPNDNNVFTVTITSVQTDWKFILYGAVIVFISGCLIFAFRTNRTR